MFVVYSNASTYVIDYIHKTAYGFVTECVYISGFYFLADFGCHLLYYFEPQHLTSSYCQLICPEILYNINAKLKFISTFYVYKSYTVYSLVPKEKKWVTIQHLLYSGLDAWGFKMIYYYLIYLI